MGDVDFVGSFFSEEVLDYSVLFGKTTDVYFEYDMYSEVKLSLSMNYCQYMIHQQAPQELNIERRSSSLQ